MDKPQKDLMNKKDNNKHYIRCRDLKIKVIFYINT